MIHTVVENVIKPWIGCQLNWQTKTNGFQKFNNFIDLVLKYNVFLNHLKVFKTNVKINSVIDSTIDDGNPEFKSFTCIIAAGI